MNGRSMTPRLQMLSLGRLVAAAAWCTSSGVALAVAPCPSRNVAAQLLAPAIARHGIATVRLGNRRVDVGTYLLAAVNAIARAGEDRCSVRFTVTLFPSDAGRQFLKDEAHTAVGAANANVFDNHETRAALVRHGDGWQVDARDLLPWLHR
jgi:hypothetical protein